MTATYASLVSALTYPAPTHVLPPAVTYYEFQQGLAALQPGQTLPSHGVPFLPETTIVKDFGSGHPPARLYFDKYCKFPGGAGNLLPALYLKKVIGVQLVFDPLALITNPYGAGIRLGDFAYGVIDGFYARGLGTDGFDGFPTVGDVHHSLIRGEVSNWSLDPSLDPHREKGTGFHGANLADAGPYTFHDNVVAIYAHDSKLGGSGVEYGNPAAGNEPHNNALYVKASRLYQDATQQVAANALNLWGDIGSVDVKIVEADTLHGKAVSSAPYTFQNVLVESGSALHCCLNPLLHGQSPWDKAQVRYGTVTTA